MHIDDRTEILQNLGSASGALAETLLRVTEELAGRTPKPGSWSIRECMEHVALVEEYLFHQISIATPSSSAMANVAREAMIVEVGMDRTRRFDAPEEVKPRNRFSTLKDAVEHFHLSRAKTIQFVEDCLDDPRTMLARHPRFGIVNNYEMLLMMAIHPHRHAAQIREIAETLSP